MFLNFGKSSKLHAQFNLSSMKFQFTILLMLLTILSSTAQQAAETEVKQVVIDFFKGFHQKDSVAITKTLLEDFSLGTIGKNKEGAVVFKETASADFIKNIVTIPDEVVFEEKLLSYQVAVDKYMANVWTPYEFWLNGKFSHCGVNSFHLMKTTEGWRILSIVDTRYRKDCSNSEN